MEEKRREEKRDRDRDRHKVLCCGGTYGAADGTRAKEITGAGVAARDGVVGQLLLHCPVHVLEVGVGDNLAFSSLG